MAGEVFGFFADDLSEPFFDLGGFDVVVVDPAFVSGVVRRVDVDAFDAPGILGEEGFEGVEVIALDDEVSGIWVATGEFFIRLEEAEGDIFVMVDDGVFSDPVEGGHREEIAGRRGKSEGGSEGRLDFRRGA